MAREVVSGNGNGNLETWKTPGVDYEGWIAGFKPGKMFGTTRSRYMLLEREGSGEIVTMSLPQMLEDEMQKSNLGVGCWIGIRYLERRMSKAGKPFHFFEVARDLEKDRPTGARPGPRAGTEHPDSAEIEALRAQFLQGAGPQGPALLAMLERNALPGELAETLRRVTSK